MVPGDEANGYITFTAEEGGRGMGEKRGEGRWGLTMFSPGSPLHAVQDAQPAEWHNIP